jgi:hydrogenase expression/formation protein HypC
MCVGTPMQLLEDGQFSALATGRDGQRQLSLLLTGALNRGDHVLAQGDLAIRVIDAEEAQLITRALDGCEAAQTGGSFHEAFADLINQEPQLPDWLRAAPASPTEIREEAHG